MRDFKLRSISLLAVAASTVLFGGRSKGAVIVSNLGDTVTGTQAVYPGDGQNCAEEFVTGSQSATLTDVIVDIGNPVIAGPSQGVGETSGPSVGNPNGQGVLYSDNSGSPGTVLTALSFPSSFSAGDTTLTPTSAITLAANTGYWVVLSDADTNETDEGFSWRNTSTTSSSFPNNGISENNGSSYNFNSFSGAFELEVDGAVPEPASVGIVALGAMGMLRRRRKFTAHGRR